MRAMVNKVILDEFYVYQKNYEVDIKGYKDYYKHLECGLFDVVRVMWEGEEISIFLDDEGLLKGGNVGRRVEGYPQPLFGNFVICGGVDDEGNTLPLPEKFTEDNIGIYIGIELYQVKKGMN